MAMLDKCTRSGRTGLEPSIFRNHLQILGMIRRSSVEALPSIGGEAGGLRSVGQRGYAYIEA